MKKLLLVTALSAFTILSATSAFAQEAPAGGKSSGMTLDVPANTAFPSEEKLKEVHHQMVNNMMKDIVGAPETKKRVRREAWKTSEIGQEWTHKVNFYHIPVHDMHLETRFKIYSNHAEIISTSTAGTTSVWPGAYSSKESFILTNNERIVTSQAKFTGTISIIKNGIGELVSRDFTITTTIHVRYAGDGIIHFTTQSVFSS